MAQTNHPNIINKWYVACASSSLPGRLTAVNLCIINSPFKWSNPNNVYALLGTLARNTRALASEEGLLNQLLNWIHKVDLINGQVASRLLQPLIAYHAWDKDTKDKFRNAFQSFIILDSHSKDVREVLSRLDAVSSAET